MPEIKVKRMWAGGPLRQWAELRPRAGWVACASGGFAGQYVCDVCSHAVVGVRRQFTGDGKDKWLCAGCLDSARVKQEQPAGLKAHRERANA